MATQTPQRNRSLPVQERFQHMTGSEFSEEIDRLWDAAENVVQTVKKLVQQDSLGPQEGVAIIACATGQLFGYQAFHGQYSPADLASSLRDQIR